MFLSIVIPVHNSERFIRDCLDSCYEQDISEQDYEIICVDDGSTDNSVGVIREYKKEHNNLKLVILKKNKGVSVARNIGMTLMKGDFCMFMDSDDYIADNCLKRFKSILQECKQCTEVCFGQFNFEEIGNKNRKDNINHGFYMGCPTERYITNRLIPTVLLRNLRFHDKIAYGEDEVLSIELSLFNATIIKIEEPLYFYRKHSASAMYLTTEKRRKRIESLIISATYLKAKYGDKSKEITDFINERVRAALRESMLQSPRYRYKYFLLLLRERAITVQELTAYIFRIRAKRIKRNCLKVVDFTFNMLR